MRKYLRQAYDGSVLIGEGSQKSLHLDDSREHANDLLGRDARYLPALAGVHVTSVPVGFRPMPIDGYPVSGFTQVVPKLYIPLTHSGITLCPLVSELVTLEVADGTRVEFLQNYHLSRIAK